MTMSTSPPEGQKVFFHNIEDARAAARALRQKMNACSYTEDWDEYNRHELLYNHNMKELIRLTPIPPPFSECMVTDLDLMNILNP